MTTDHVEVLSAFFDGEAVEPDALAASLENPEAVELLLEFARLRRAVHEDTSRPSVEFSDALFEKLARHEKRRQSVRRLARMSLAASLVLAAAYGGFSARGILEERQRVAPEGRVMPASQAPRPKYAIPREVTAPNAKPSRPIPSPNLRIRFAEWRDAVL